jgi:nitrogen-specific signal transduction histidine kinase/ActR/RegA family two-component response regulator
MNSEPSVSCAEWEAQRLRAQRLEAIRRLAGGMAHDLNNILTPILMASQLLAAKGREESDRKLLDIITASAHRAADVVRQVLTFARGIPGERKRLSPGPLLDSVRLLTSTMFTSAIEVRTAIPPNLWPIQGDASQLHQMLLNLCLNARDAMREGGRLSLSAENVVLREPLPSTDVALAPGHYVKLEVADTGPGIPPEIAQSIFEPFFTTKPVGQGDGLGLASALGVARAHGGGLRARNGAPGGAVFEVYLPVAETPVAIPPAPPKADPGQPAPGKKVLVVDDDALVREIARTTLEVGGFHVITAENGERGLEAFVQNRGNLTAILSDTMMPGMDGVEMIRALRQIDNDVPVISASGFSTESKLAELRALRVTAFLPKPFTPDMLLKTMAEVVRLPQPATA